MKRRDFFGMGAAALAGVALMPGLASCGNPEAKPATKVDNGKPNSNFGGVHIGLNTYSWRDMPGGMENMLKYCKEANMSNLELRINHLEEILGIPKDPTWDIRRAALERLPEKEREAVQKKPGGVDALLTAEDKQIIADYKKSVDDFRYGMDMAKVEQVLERFNSEGINIHIAKMMPDANSTDEFIEYSFKVAQALKAPAITAEMTLESAKKCAPYAEKYDIYYVLHNHYQYATPEYVNGPDEVLAVSPKIMLNFDFGHYFGSTGKNPCDFIEKYHDRIYSMHCKDKTGPNAAQPNENQVWGQGETPLEEVLKLVQSKYQHIYCDVELEYPVAPWSNSVKEVATCVKFAQRVLLLG